jgi:hemolysin III
MAKNQPFDIEQHWALGDEWANTLTHGIGLALSLIGVAFLIYSPLMEGHPWKLFSFSIFGLTLVLLYGVSTLYHYCHIGTLKHFYRLLDHCAIYLLIAGSYTPFTLISLQGIWGWALCITVWSLAIVGIVLKCCFVGKFNRLSLGLYLVMGWLIVFALEPLVSSLSAEGLWWLAAGGLFYTGGIVFYVLDRIRFFHAIWHLFVLGGSLCHYFAILLYV